MTHKNLKVWQRSVELTTTVYKVAEDFPAIEKYNLLSQVYRSAISVPCNIAEGVARGSSKEYVRFLNIAIASLIELDTQLVIADKLGYTNTEILREGEIKEIAKMLHGLKASIQARISN